MQLSAIVPRGHKMTLLVSSVVAFWAFVPKAGVGAVSYSDAVIKDGPIAYYRLEQPLYAGSSTYSTNIGTGQALHGLYRNFAAGEMAQSGPQPPIWPGFSAGNLAPVFDATNNYVEWTEGASQPTPLDITGPLTLEAWVKLDAGADLSGAPGVVSKYSGSGNQRSYTLRVYTDGKANFAISDDGVWKSAWDFRAGDVLAPGQWYHLAATYTPSESMKLYVNGSMVGQLTSSIPSSLHSGSAPLWIGTQNTTNPDRVFPGQIDEVAVYSKALSEQQIAAHYEAALEPARNPAAISGLKAWYQIDNGTQLAYESSDSSYRAGGWQDSSGNDRIMQQAAVASQPILRQDQLGGYPALKFDGSNDWLSAGDGDFHSNTDGLTVIAVARREGTTSAQAIGAQYKTTTNQREWAMTRSFFTVQQNPASYNSAMDASFGSPDTEWHIYSGRWVPGIATEAYLDGILKGTALNPAASMNDTGVPLSLGAYADGSNYRWDGMIAEVLVFNRALTEKQHNAVGWYLAQKYGLQTAFVPEPSAAVLLGIGMVAVLMSRRRRR